MGFIDRLKQIGRGAADIATVPVGLVWDLARSFPDEDYNAGDAFGDRFSQLGRGLGRVSQGTGINAVASGIASNTPVDEGIQVALKELELLYNQEFQVQQNQAPLGFRQAGAQPGSFSIARGFGTATGAVGDLVHGGLSAVSGNQPQIDVLGQWKKAKDRSPGQALIDELFLQDDYSFERTDGIKASAAYNISTGTVDAVARWWGQPEVIAGKGLKVARMRFNPSYDRLLRKALRKRGVQVAEGFMPDGITMTLQADDATPWAWTVVRNSDLDGPFTNRGVHIFTDSDEALRYASDLRRLNPDDVPVVLRLDRDGLPVIDDTLLQPGFNEGSLVSTLEGIDSRVVDFHYFNNEMDPFGSFSVGRATKANDPAFVDRRVGEILDMSEDEFIRMYGNGPGLGDNIRSSLNIDAPDPRPNGLYSEPIIGPRTNTQVGTTYQLVNEGKLVGVLETWMTADNLPGMSLAISKTAHQSSLMRLLNKVFRENPEITLEGILNKLGEGQEGIFSASLTLSDQSARMFHRLIGLSEKRLRRSGKDLIGRQLVEPRKRPVGVYNPDGSPIEPRLAHSLDETYEVINGAVKRFNEAGEAEAVRFLRGTHEARVRPSQPQSVQDIVMNHKVTQHAINNMIDMDADQIRRGYLSRHPFGDVLAPIFASAETYDELYWMLAAAGGLKIPETAVMRPLAQARIEKLTKRMYDLQAEPAARQALTELEYGMLTGNTSDVLGNHQQSIINLQNEMATLQRQEELGGVLSDLYGLSPLREVPRMTGGAHLREWVRSSVVYQESPLARPFRAVSEMRPHRFISMSDPQASTQIVRQLEEAQSLGITGDEVKGFRIKFMEAQTDQARMQITIQMEDKILQVAARRAGMTKSQLQVLVSRARSGRQGLYEFLESHRYAPENLKTKFYKGEQGVDRFRWLDEDTGEIVEMVTPMPLLGTQTKNWVPLSDVRAIISQTSRIRRVTSRGGQIPKEMLDSFYHLWKPTVLLRGGWPIRVVADEQLRILAMTNSLVHHLSAIEAGTMPPWTTFKKGQGVGAKAASGFGLVASVPTAGVARIASAIAKGLKKIRAVDPEYAAYLEQAGLENLVSSRAGFSGPDQAVQEQFASLLGVYESGFVDAMRSRGSGQWMSVEKGHRTYGTGWQRALNQQLNDPFVHVLYDTIIAADPKNLSELVKAVGDGKRRMLAWLKTPEGKAYGENVPWFAQNPENWVDSVVGLAGHYTVDFNPALLQASRKGNVTFEMMEAIPENLRPPSVHAEILDQTFGRGAVASSLNEMLAVAFDTFGRLPTDTLSRQPMFRQLYADEMMRIRKLKTSQGDEWTTAAENAASKQSRQYAISETKRWLYDLAETSRFGHMVRWFMPFFPAWQEVLTVWAGLIKRDPSIVPRAVMLWRAPDKVGLTTTNDEGEQFINLRLSEKMSDKLGFSGFAKYVATGGVSFGKSSFNLVLNSPLPGSGPVLQFPANEIVKRNPDLESRLKWLLPYGVRQNWRDLLLSPVVKRLGATINSSSGQASYQRDFFNALLWMDHEYRSGERTTPPTYEEAHEIAGKINTVRLVANLISPSQPIFDTPLKPYIDLWRDLVEQYGPEEAENIFITQYGEEFFGVTISRTVSKTGIPPTVDAQLARKELEGLIERYPEYGRLILGEEAGLGEFSTAAFVWQLDHDVRVDGVESPERAYRQLVLDPDTGTVEEVDSRLGWRKYLQAMDLLEIERKRRGLPNLRVKGAEDLATLKKAITQNLSTQYPGWWRAFNKRDDLKWSQRVKDFRAITKNSLMEDRPDIEGIDQYLKARELVLAELNRRRQLGGSATLASQSNRDLSILWESLVAQILDQNIAFAPIYFRYLEGDPLELSNG